MRTILVIRISEHKGLNPNLREALMGTYSPLTPMYPIPGDNVGGMISCLMTDYSFEEIANIVKNSNCGEACIVVDANPTDPKTLLIPASNTISIQGMQPAQIESEITKLLEKQRTDTLNADEEERLRALLDS